MNSGGFQDGGANPLMPFSVPRSLRRLPREKEFYFFTSIGNYSGQHASSLEEFVTKIRQVNVKSLEFHFHRGDFERWVAEVLEDEELANAIKSLHNFSPLGDVLRDQLYLVVRKRYEKLRGQNL